MSAPVRSRIRPATALSFACAAVVITSAAAIPAAASSCGSDVAALESRLNNEGATAGAATTGGQATAAARSGKAVEAAKTGKPVSDLANPPKDENEAGTKEAKQAGVAGEGVMAAKVSLNQARNAAAKGDEAGCRTAYKKAKDQSGL